jgi:AcrR family transcriptional regulator
MPVPRGANLDPARTRAAIIDTATELLYDRGLDGIGIAELCTTMGVSKETLYRHFGSKDGLIQTVLTARSDNLVQELVDAAAGAGTDPATRLTAVFDALDHRLTRPAFRGCAMMNAVTQHRTGPIRALAENHLDRYLDLLTGIAQDAGARDAVTLGKQLLALLEGAVVLAANHPGHRDAAQSAKKAALVLLQAT